MIKYFIFFLLTLSSCTSFFLHNIEQYNQMYVTDTIGCRLANVRVITTKTNTFDTEVLSFITITDRDTIQIPLLKWDWSNPPYHGIGLDNRSYTVYYEGKKTIKIFKEGKLIVLLSRTNNCNK